VSNVDGSDRRTLGTTDDDPLAGKEPPAPSGITWTDGATRLMFLYAGSLWSIAAR
jgi:hypothetical protein